MPQRPAVQQEAARAFPTLKAVAILETLATARRPLGISELTALLGFPKPTAHRIVRMLEAEGLLQREPGGRHYAPGARLLRLGLDIISASMQHAPRHAILAALSHQVGETCNFGVMSGSHVVYLDRVEAAWPFGLRFEPGSRVPLHCTAMGKLFLSALPAPRRASVLRAAPLYRYTENTITDPALLDQELDRIAARGVSTDNQEFLAGVACVAVPVRGPGGPLAAALAVSAPIARMTLARGLEWVPLLENAAARLGDTIESPGRAPASDPAGDDAEHQPGRERE